MAATLEIDLVSADSRRHCSAWRARHAELHFLLRAGFAGAARRTGHHRTPHRWAAPAPSGCFRCL